MKKLKVLHITQSLGGVETHLREIIAHIDPTRFELVVLSPPSASLSAWCDRHGVRHETTRMARGLAPLTDAKTLVRMVRLLRRERPDLVHLHSSKAGFLGRIACKLTAHSSLFTPNGVSYLSFRGWKRMAYFALETMAKPLTDHVLAVSHSEANRLIFEVGHHPETVQTLLNSVTFGATAERPSPRRFHNREVRIGTVARLTHQKNPLMLVNVAKQVMDANPDVHFYLLGAGLHDHLKTEVDALIAAHGIGRRFHLLNWGDQGSSDDFIRSLDVFVLTSLFEGLPYSLLEAMRAGVPCVVSTCDGCLDVIRNEVNGLSCLTQEEFVGAIQSLLADPELATRLGQEGQRHAAHHHNSERTIRQLARIYSRLCGQPFVEPVPIPASAVEEYQLTG